MTSHSTQLSLQTGERSEPSQLLQLAALFEISSQAVTLDIEPLLGLILDQLKNIVDYTNAAVVGLAGEELAVLALRGASGHLGLKNWRLHLHHAQVHRRVIQERTAIIIPDIWADTAQAVAFRRTVGPHLGTHLQNLHAWMGIPLLVKDRLYGMLALFHHQSHRYGAAQAEQVLVFAQQTAMALENDRLYQQVHHLATVAERERLAREMHDQLAQALGYINIKASIINDLLDNGQIDQAQGNLQELRQIARDTYTDVREEIFNLRTKISAEEKFLPLLRNYVAEYQRQHQIAVSLMIADERLELSPAVGTQLIRIIQEALHNVRKHAQADQVIIRLEPDQERMCLSVEDNGRGFSLQPDSQNRTSYGLQIMRERAQCIGGALEISSKPNRGTQIRVWVPDV